MGLFMVTYHLLESKHRQAAGGLRSYGGEHTCLIKRNSMKEVLQWVADTLAPDVIGLDIRPVEAEVG